MKCPHCQNQIPEHLLPTDICKACLAKKFAQTLSEFVDSVDRLGAALIARGVL